VLAAAAGAGALGALGPGAAALAAGSDVDTLLDGSALDLRAAVARGLVSPVEVAEATARRIAAGTRLNAVVEFDADAFVESARRLARARGARRLPLHGVPVALKDNVDALPYRITAARRRCATIADLKQIEILKGPQGAIYGRNASAGAIIVTAHDPQNEFGGQATASVGNFNTFNGNVTVGGAIVDGRLRARRSGPRAPTARSPTRTRATRSAHGARARRVYASTAS
jgi:hypothetical protein